MQIPSLHSTVPATPLAGVDARVHDFMLRLSSETSASADLLGDHQVADAIAQKIKSFVLSPLQGFLTMRQDATEHVVALLDAVILEHVKGIAERTGVVGLWRVAPVETSLEYVVALREDAAEYRAPFREFKAEYEDSGLDDEFPLMFHLLPERFASHVTNAQPIALA